VRRPASSARPPTSRRAQASALAAALLTAAFVLLLAAPALAHDRTTSYSTWEIQGRGARVTVRLSLLDASRFPWFFEDGADEKMKRYLAQRLQLVAGNTPCEIVGEPERLDAPLERLVYEWHLSCPEAGELSIHNDLLLDVAPSHLHFARVTRDGTALLERVLSDAERSWPLPAKASGGGGDDGGTTLAGYVQLGIEHILTGYDHLAFLFALLLIEGSMWEVAKVVTGFTVGHSLTLALAILGVVRPETGAIEALIGLSIALVAGENLWLLGGRPRFVPWGLGAVLLALGAGAAAGFGRVPGLTLAGLALFSLSYFELLERVSQPVRLRWAVAFLFGLVHGFGFAGVLVEAHLPTQRLVQALFGFNAGVEIGQIGVVVLVWPLLAYFTRRAGGRLVVEMTSAAVLALGAFWFVTRAYG
jgi:hypothetical protein